MTDPGAAVVTAQEAELMKKMFDFFLHFSKTNRSQEGGASSSNLGNEPEKRARLSDADAENGEELVEHLRYLTKNELKKAAMVKRLLKTKRLSESIKTKLEDVEKIYSSFRTNMLELKTLVGIKNGNINETIEEIEKITSTEIHEIKRNVVFLKHKEDETKAAIERNIKTLKNEEAQAKTQVRKNIEEMENKLAMTKEQVHQNIREMNQYEAQKRGKIDREIQNMKEIEAEKKHSIGKSIEALLQCKAEVELNMEKNIAKLKKSLFKNKIKSQIKIKAMRKYEAEWKRKIQAKIRIIKKEEAIMESTTNDSHSGSRIFICKI